MCGIAGIVNFDGSPIDLADLRRMTDAIAHRGPDGEGHYIKGSAGLGHRRLAIIDLSDAARQPIANEAGDVVVTYNGEIYNFAELRAELEQRGHRFRSRTDSEVVVHAYEEWGDDCVARFNGMFAFALHDARPSAGRGRLFLARDRYGVKPLYYRVGAPGLLFASEIKALLRHPAVTPRISWTALGEYFTFQNVFGEETLFDGVRLLPPGSTLSVSMADGRICPKRYWDYTFAPGGFDYSDEGAAEELHRLFERAVVRQLVSDVPVGAYLSGGMDSGSIAAVATRHITRMRTFTGGFDLSSASGLELGFDERRAAEIMANRFKTEHYEMVMHAGDMEHVLPELIWHLEDLRVGQSYPNYYVARLAGRFVKVVLSGAGGDELFGGYPWRYYRGLQGGGRERYVDEYYDYWQRLVPDQDRARFFNERTYRELRDYDARTAFEGVFAGHASPTESTEDLINASLYFESKTFLHGLLVVEDKISMAHGLETRVPFLDNDLVDFAQKVPPRLKLRELDRAPHVDENEPGKLTRYHLDPAGDGKMILRKAMRTFVPAETAERRKQGFSAPDASWFAGESIDYVRRLLCSDDARINEFLNPVYVRDVIDEHSKAVKNHRLLIWSLLSFEWWCRGFLEGNPPARTL